MPSLTFLGAAGTVTGSKHLLDTGTHRVLVDCGLFQGLKELRERNWQPLPIAAGAIDAVILTHAHLDHCGYLPRLVAQGFKGRVFCTAGTRDLCSLVLPDSAHIQEEDARDANRHGYSKHHPALPLYTANDAARALSLLQPVGYNRPMPVVPGLDVEFINAGHLLGSAYARVTFGGKTILFGGDLGRYGRPFCPIPLPVDRADILLVESTYGDRLHDPDDDGDQLAAIVNAAVAARRQADHPGVCDRPGRRSDLLAEASRRRKAHSDPARLRRQPDGRPGAAVLRAARRRARPGHAEAGTRRLRVLHDAHDDCLLGAAVD